MSTLLQPADIVSYSCRSLRNSPVSHFLPEREVVRIYSSFPERRRDRYYWLFRLLVDPLFERKVGPLGLLRR